jgi:hypothetical protein
MEFLTWLKRKVSGAAQKPLSHRAPRTKAQADRHEQIEIRDKQIDPIKLRRDKKPRNRFRK